MSTRKIKDNRGFSLAEILVYTAIIGIVGTLFGGVLVTVTKVQTKQSSSAEVSQQLNFILQTAQRLIKESSLIEIAAGTPVSSLKLRMKNNSQDPILLYLENNAAYLKTGTADPVALTTNAVIVDKLQFTKITSYPGHDSVQIDATVSYNTNNPEQQFSKSRSSAVARVSAAVFDSDIVPGTPNTYDVGLTDTKWKNLYLSGSLTIGNTLTLGNLSSDPSGSNGMVYYNITLNAFRGFRNGAWADLGYWNLSGNNIYSNVSGNVGIGNPSPSEKLAVTGNASISGSISSASLNVSGTAQLGGFKMATGAVQGKVLTSDASGVGTWQTPTGEGIPPGYSILGDTTSSPAGYTYTGNYIKAIGPGTWTTKANMPTSRYRLASVMVNNKIYAIGGDGIYDDLLAVNEEYDPATDSWTTKASMPTTRHSLAAAAVNNKIYAIGGWGPDPWTPEIQLNINEEYNPVTNTWATKANMPTARYVFAAAAVNNKIYAIGGSGASSYLNTNEEYDPAANTWAIKADMPTGRHTPSAAVINNKVYVIGGYNGSILAINEEYNPATNTWATKANMPTSRYRLAAAAVNDKIYAIGGYVGGTSYLNTNEEYDPAANAWATKANMTTGRQWLAAAAVNNKIYAIGGYTTIELNKNEEYNPIPIYYVHKKN